MSRLLDEAVGSGPPPLPLAPESKAHAWHLARHHDAREPRACSCGEWLVCSALVARGVVVLVRSAFVAGLLVGAALALLGGWWAS
jgi:hypothetical protein